MSILKLCSLLMLFYFAEIILYGIMLSMPLQD